MVYSGSGVAGLSPLGIGLNHVVVDTLGMWALLVTSRSETCPSSCIGMSSEDCSECSDSDTDIQEKEQKESQRQTNPSTEWKGQSQKSSK
ncbi:hypothetical protein Tco_0280159 [Tanacetum coccineum]